MSTNQIGGSKAIATGQLVAVGSLREREGRADVLLRRTAGGMLFAQATVSGVKTSSPISADKAGEIVNNYASYGLTKEEAEKLQAVFNSRDFRTKSAGFLNDESSDVYFESLKTSAEQDKKDAAEIYFGKFKRYTTPAAQYCTFSVPDTKIKIKAAPADFAAIKRAEIFDYVCTDPYFSGTVTTLTDRIYASLQKELKAMLLTAFSSKENLVKLLAPQLPADKFEDTFRSIINILYADYFRSENTNFTEDQLKDLAAKKDEYFVKTPSGLYKFKKKPTDEDMKDKLKTLWDQANREVPFNKTFEEKTNYVLQKLNAKVVQILSDDKILKLIQSDNVDEVLKAIIDESATSLTKDKFTKSEGAIVFNIFDILQSKALKSRNVQNAVFVLEVKTYSYKVQGESQSVFQTLTSELLKKLEAKDIKELMTFWMRERIREITGSNTGAKTIEEMLAYCLTVDFSKLPKDGDISTVFFYSAASVKQATKKASEKGGKEQGVPAVDISDIEKNPMADQEVLKGLNKALSERELTKKKCAELDESQVEYDYLKGKTVPTKKGSANLAGAYTKLYKDKCPMYTSSNLDPDKFLYVVPGVAGEASANQAAEYMAKKIISQISDVLEEKADKGEDSRYSTIRDGIYLAMAESMKDGMKDALKPDKIEAFLNQRLGQQRAFLAYLNIMSLYDYYTDGKIDKAEVVTKLPWIVPVLKDYFDETPDSKLKIKKDIYKIIREKKDAKSINDEQIKGLLGAINAEPSKMFEVVGAKISAIIDTLITAGDFDPSVKGGSYAEKIGAKIAGMTNLSASEKSLIMQLIAGSSVDFAKSKKVQDAEEKRVRYIVGSDDKPGIPEYEAAMGVLANATKNGNNIGQNIAENVRTYLKNRENYVNLKSKQITEAQANVANVVANQIPDDSNR